MRVRIFAGIVKEPPYFGDVTPLYPSIRKACLRCVLQSRELDETAKTEVLLYDDIIDSGHNESYLGGVGSASEMGVDLFGLMLVQADESVEDVVASQGVIITTFVVREVVLHWADWQLLLESINLVQEQDYRGLDEPSRIADRVKKSKGLLHTIDGLVLKQKLVVLGNGNEEEDGCDILEAMDPLLSFRSLSSHIEHAISKVSDDEGGLRDTSSLDTRSENILVVGHIVWLSDTLDVVEVVSGRIVQLVLS